MTQDPKPCVRLLDLFCGAGGASAGYARAGWDVVGVDLVAQPNYPYTFHQADALTFSLDGFDAIHASPPCQRYSKLTRRHGDAGHHPDLIAEVREQLRASGKPYVIENVPGSPLLDPIRLCGSAFGLDVQRHRLFESNVCLVAPPCNHALQTPRFPLPDRRISELACVVPIYGHTNYLGEADLRRRAMEAEWMTNRELAQSIPPAFTEYLGRQLWLAVRAKAGEPAR